jgi:cation/acetate symporter
VGGAIPEWLRQLAAMGLADVDIKPLAGPGESNRNILTSIGLSRDAVLFALPMAAGLSQTFVALAVAGGLAACLTGASAAATALAALVAEDLLGGHKLEAPHDRPRLAVARTCLIGVVASGCTLAAALPGDSFDYLLWSLALTASTVFPVLLFSIWWKRTNGFGAVAGMASGFGVALLAMIAGGLEWLPLDPALAGTFGIPAAAIATIAASLSTPYPSRHVLELVRDIRVPGGEILYDREMRLLRLKKRERASDPV